MKNNFSISIKNPCPANWDEMTPGGMGKFCSQCSLTVVDFTAMSDSEIKEYFSCHFGQKTCGRFTNAQLEKNNSRKNFFQSYFNKIEKTKISIFLLSILTCLSFIIGCKRPAYNPHIVGDVDVMGEPQFIERVDSTRINTK